MNLYQAGVPYTSKGDKRMLAEGVRSGSRNFLISYAHRNKTPAIPLMKDLAQMHVVEVPNEVGVSFLDWLGSRPATCKAFEEFVTGRSYS